MWLEYDDYIKHNQLLDDMTTGFAVRGDLTKLPELPNNIKQLHCYRNKLIYLPALPNKLIFLDCGYNKLTELPELPETLSGLWCENNNIKYLSQHNCEVIKNIHNLNILDNPVSNRFDDNKEFKDSL